MAVKLLHDPAVRVSIEARLQRLSPDARAQWGKFSVDRMLWHINEAMLVTLGEAKLDPAPVPLPGPVLRFVVLNLPWVKGAPTNPALIPAGRHDFETERARCLSLVARVTSRRVDDSWPRHPVFGAMSGRDVSRLHAKHLDHHLRQFGV